jgi:antitoxin HicB
MATRKFSVVLLPEGEGWFSVRVPALPEVVTQGCGREQALERAVEAIELALEQRIADGEEIPADNRFVVAEVSVEAAA